MEITIDDRTFTFGDEGSGEPAVVLLHGFPLSRWIWSNQVESLSKKYRIITPDLRGHGGTPPVENTASMDHFADDVAILLDKLGVENMIVGGHSMGGYIVFSFWRKFPERIKGMILVDTRSEADPPDGREARFRMIQLVEEKGAVASADEMVGKILGATSKRIRPGLVEDIHNVMSATPVDGIKGALLGMAGRPNSTPDLRRITCPTLVIVGEEDTLTPPESARQMALQIPQARLEVIPLAGHVPTIENPDLVTGAMEDFLASAVSD